MDHIRISGTEPSSVFLSQTKNFQKLQIDARKCQNKLKQKGVVKKPTNLQFQSISTRTIFMLSKSYESTEVDRRTWLHVASGLTGSPAVTLIK